MGESIGQNDFIQHGSEIPFVFGNKIGSSESNDFASKQIGTFWTNLAKFQDPNGASGLGQTASWWPQVDSSAPILAHFQGTNIDFAPPDRTKFCDFWEDLLGSATRVKQGGDFEFVV